MRHQPGIFSAPRAPVRSYETVAGLERLAREARHDYRKLAVNCVVEESQRRFKRTEEQRLPVKRY